MSRAPIIRHFAFLLLPVLLACALWLSGISEAHHVNERAIPRPCPSMDDSAVAAKLLPPTPRTEPQFPDLLGGHSTPTKELPIELRLILGISQSPR